MKYYIDKFLDNDFESALFSAKEALRNEGFGILTEIKIEEKLQEKLGIKNYRKYRILGAFNPALAYDALELDDKIGTMMPCSIIVKELSDDKTEVAAINPVAIMQTIENKDVERFVELLSFKLKKAVNAM